VRPAVIELLLLLLFLLVLLLLLLLLLEITYDAAELWRMKDEG
jgi:hypothetical protein